MVEGLRRENPYFAFLGLADAIVVTGDSMSMLTEACAAARPVHIFDLGEGRNAMRRATREAAAASRPRRRGRPERTHLNAFLYRLMMRFGPQRLGRDIRIIHEDLIAAGLAVWLGDAFPSDRPLPPLDCIERAVTRVRALFDFVPSVASVPREPIAVFMPAPQTA